MYIPFQGQNVARKTNTKKNNNKETQTVMKSHQNQYQITFPATLVGQTEAGHEWNRTFASRWCLEFKAVKRERI